MAYAMLATRQPPPSLLDLLLLWTAILVVCSTVLTATSTTVDSQPKRYFKNSTAPAVPDRNEERAPWPWFGELVDKFMLGSHFGKAKLVDKYLAKASLESRAGDAFTSEQFQIAVDKTLDAYADNQKLAQKAIFKGLKRAARARDRADMFFELGRTIGMYKTVDTSPRLSRREIHGSERYQSFVKRYEAYKKQRPFVLGLEPHLLHYWAKGQVTPEAVWKGFELNILKRGEFRNPSFCVYVDYIIQSELDKLAGYDWALNYIRHSSTLSPVTSLPTVPDVVIAQQLVDAGAPSRANDVIMGLMQALFRDWDKQGMTPNQLFYELLPAFTFELESLLQGPMELWIKYFRTPMSHANYKMLLETILERAKSGNAVKGLADPLAAEKRLVWMYTGAAIQPNIAAKDLAYRATLLFQEAFRHLERKGMTADKMLDFLKIRGLQNQELVNDPHLWTWMSFTIDRHGTSKSVNRKRVRSQALVKSDFEFMFNHLNHHMRDNDLVLLVEMAVGGDHRFYQALAYNLVNKWKLAGKSSHDVFLLLNFENVSVNDLLMKKLFPLWFRFGIETSGDEVKASLEMRMILEMKYAENSFRETARRRPTFDEVLKKGMDAELSRPRVYQCIGRLWSVKLLNEGVPPNRVKLDTSSKKPAITFYEDYISTRKEAFGKKLEVSLPAGFS